MKPHIDDLIPLYLIQHPDDERFFQMNSSSGEPLEMISGTVLARFAQWGEQEGYFPRGAHSKAQQLMSAISDAS